MQAEAIKKIFCQNGSRVLHPITSPRINEAVINTTNPAAPAWSAANDIGRNFSALNFIYYDRSDNVVTPATLANRVSIARIDIRLTAQTSTPLSNATQPAYSLALRTIPRNLKLRSAN